MPDAVHDFGFEHVLETDQSFENALVKARAGERPTVDDGVELIMTGIDREGIGPERKEFVLEAVNRRRAETVGNDVTFVANLNNNVMTACSTGCLFCNFKNTVHLFEADSDADHGGFTKTSAESRDIVADAVEMGIYEVTSVSGLHSALVLDEKHREILEAYDNPAAKVNYKPPEAYDTDPANYAEQLSAMSAVGVHAHSMTPEEAHHTKHGTGWSYEEVYRRLADASLASVPGITAEILVPEVREVIYPGKIGTDEWAAGMEGAMEAGLDVTATIMYDHVETEKYRVLHLDVTCDLQDRHGGIPEFVPLSFIHQNTPLYDHGLVIGDASDDEDELVVAIARFYLDNVDHIQSSWVKFGSAKALRLLGCGADDLMGTILSEEITKRAGSGFGEFRSFGDHVDMIIAVGRRPAEHSTDYRIRRLIDPDDGPHGPMLDPRADGTPLLDGRHDPATADD